MSDKTTITLPNYQWEAILRGLASSGWDSMHAVLSEALAQASTGSTVQDHANGSGA